MSQTQEKFSFVPLKPQPERNNTYSMKRLQGAEATKALSTAGALIDSGRAKAHFPSAHLERADARAYLIDSGGSQYTSVTYRIAGTGSAPMSNLTILMDASGKPIQQAESVFTKGETGNFHLTTYVDGAVKKNNANTGIRYVSEAQQREGLRQAASAVAAEGGKNTGACLAAVLGVSGVVGGAIAYACAGSCSVPMTPVTGPVCAACVGGFAVVGGASITAIASCF